MTWVFGIVIVLLMGVIAVVAAGGGDPVAPAYDDRPDVLPSGGATAFDASMVRTARFRMTWRGYDPAQVDTLLAQVDGLLAQAAAQLEPEPEPEVAPDAPITPSEH